MTVREWWPVPPRFKTELEFLQESFEDAKITQEVSVFEITVHNKNDYRAMIELMDNFGYQSVRDTIHTRENTTWWVKKR